jgi:RNA methyltransferase, TrmH family
MILTSLQNDRVKAIVRLRERRDRDREGLMLIEGYRSLIRAVDNGVFPKEVYTCPGFYLGDNEDALIERCRAAGAEIFQCTPPVFQKMTYRERPEGLLAVAPYLSRKLEDLKLGSSPLLIVAQSIEKPGNLGTIIRSADGTGADALILCDRCTDLWNPNVITASTGMCFALPIAEAGTADTLKWLKAQGIAILSATPHATTMYTDVDMTGPVAIVVGAEQYGLTEDWMKESTINVRIPMLGKADSLNVATATTLILYEAVRQRGRRG